MRAAIAGVIVSATMPEMITAPDRVKANSANSAPVSPPVKASGASTAASVSVIATTGPLISFMPMIEASSGLCPSSMWRWMFSTTTIASSTTRPMASTIASSDNRLIEKPSASSTAHTPISDSGIVTIGISTERNEPRNRRITTTTMATASAMVLNTSSIEALIVSVES